MTYDFEKPSTTKEVETLVDEIRPLLAGNDPSLQGAALGDLVAIYIAGHHPAIREEVLTAFIALVRGMVPIVEAEIFATFGKPEGWETN